MQQKVILLGPGNVGRTFIKQVLEHDSLTIGKHNNPTVIVGVAGLGKWRFSPYGLRDEELEQIAATGELGEKAESMSSMDDILQRVNDSGLNGEIIFVDATAGKDALRDFHLKVMEQSDNGIVTANKNPISLYDQKTYQRLTKNLRYQYTTTVMAGSGIVRFLRGTRKVSDTIHSISGMFSGTLGYIASELDKGRKISEIVKEAVELGYTEPNPWDDLNGLDVARKLIILARSAGFPVEIDDIEIQPMLPERFGDIDGVDAFLDAVQEEDDNFVEKVNSAKANGEVLRYVASLENENGKLKLFVGLKAVPSDSPLGRLSGPANFVQVVTDLYTKDTPYILQTPGAGLEVTAGSLRKDLLSFLPRLENIDSLKDK